MHRSLLPAAKRSTREARPSRWGRCRPGPSRPVCQCSRDGLRAPGGRSASRSGGGRDRRRQDAGHIAPASLWAEKNGGAVWLSTTRNLQQQIDGELDRLFSARREAQAGRGPEGGKLPLPAELRGGGARTGGPPQRAAGAAARWARRRGRRHGRGSARLAGGSDRARSDLRPTGAASALRSLSALQEMLHRTLGAPRAPPRPVVANHALVMVQAALGGGEEGQLPQRYVFDEGHHLFEAADSAFARLSARTTELRRWLWGRRRRAGRLEPTAGPTAAHRGSGGRPGSTRKPAAARCAAPACWRPRRHQRITDADGSEADGTLPRAGASAVYARAPQRGEATAWKRRYARRPTVWWKPRALEGALEKLGLG